MAKHAPAGDRQIHFFAHQARAGEAGAREDFEQMVALLVSAVHEPARLVYARGGDWGIDALVGDLTTRAVIWQAKYFMPSVYSSSHRDQITKSFLSAMRGAHCHGYQIDEWILCVPSSMDPGTTQWWDRWSNEQQREHRIRITLWDESVLRRELLRPEAADVRRHYYGEATSPKAAPAPARVPASQAETAAWTGGREVNIGGTRFLLHAGAAERFAADHAWVWRCATAERIGPSPTRMRMRQFELLWGSQEALSYRDQVRHQARFLREAAGRDGLARVDHVSENDSCTTIAFTCPPRKAWRDVYFSAGSVGSRSIAISVLSAAEQLAKALHRFHAAGTSHRAIGPDSVVIGSRNEAYLADGGNAFLTWEGPEESTKDVYDLAYLIYKTLTGFAPAGRNTPPIQFSLESFPASLDELLLSCLDVRPDRRSFDAPTLTTAFHQAVQELSRGGIP